MELYVRRFARVLIVDKTGEWDEKSDRYALGLPQTIEAVRELAYRGKWRIAADLDDAEMEPLTDWLIPRPVTSSPIVAMGGACLFLDEVDIVAPSGAKRHIRTLFRRSRHVGLSIIACTQRPANVSREVSAQSTHVLVHRLHEPRDRHYMAELLQWTDEEQYRWIRYTHDQQHGAILVDMQTRRSWAIPNKGEAKALKHINPQQSLFTGEDNENDE